MGHMCTTQGFIHSAKERYTHASIIEDNNKSATHRRWSETATHNQTVSYKLDYSWLRVTHTHTHIISQREQ